MWQVNRLQNGKYSSWIFFFMQGTMDKYSNTRKFKNMHVIKTQNILLLIKIAYMEKKR